VQLVRLLLISKLLAIIFALASLIGCTGGLTTARDRDPSPTYAIATRSAASDSGPTASPQPTVTPVITPTPLPTAAESTITASTPLPTEQRNYNLCVNIASDSNGYGHVTFQRPDTGAVAITYITPIAVPLQAHLDAQGLSYLQVVDRSLSAAGLTIASSNYLESDQYFRLKQDHCKFVIVTPFYPDVAVNLSQPSFYIQNMNWLLDGITKSNPGTQILVLNYYQTDRAEFTADNSGRGLNAERIDAFNAAIAEACAQGGTIAAYPQATCIDIRPFFEGMDSPIVLGETTRADYEAALYRTTFNTPMIDDFFAKNPDGVLIGDGIHLSLAGRDRLAARLAQIIFDLNDDF
jgi:hypothetical protein